MHRRTFIKNTTIISTGLLLSSSLLQCSSNDLLLNEYIGKPSNLLSSFLKEGNDSFAYYTLSSSEFSHIRFKGDQAFVFCDKGKIVGYTIKMKGTENAEKHIEELSKQYGSKSKVFENDFGQEYSWQTDKRKLTLTFSKNYPNVPENTYFSEAVLDSGLIVF